MRIMSGRYFSSSTCLGFMIGVVGVYAAESTAEGIAFFEKKIRPVLVEHCYKCHSASSEKMKGGLLLDTREGIRKGGESGHAVVPGNLKESLLISALKHDDFEMPPKVSGPSRRQKSPRYVRRCLNPALKRMFNLILHARYVSQVTLGMQQ